MRFILLYVHRYFYTIKELNNYKTYNYVLWLMCEFFRRISQFFFNIFIRLYGWLDLYPQPLHGNTEIIVSLTTFPKRINMVWASIDSMFHQEIQPSKVCLYLSKEEFPSERDNLPRRLLKYEQLGLEIKFVDENLMPHNKYYYALQDYKDRCVVTIDDDIYYHRYTISNLWNMHVLNPKMICSNRCRKISFDNSGNWLPYNLWREIIIGDGKGFHQYLALGYSGVLYPPIHYENTGLFDMFSIKNLSLKADDLWLKVHEILYGAKVVSGEYCCTGVSLSSISNISLSSGNIGGGGNDKQWKQLCDYYNINVTRLADDIQ